MFTAPTECHDCAAFTKKISILVNLDVRKKLIKWCICDKAVERLETSTEETREYLIVVLVTNIKNKIEGHVRQMKRRNKCLQNRNQSWHTLVEGKLIAYVTAWRNRKKYEGNPSIGRSIGIQLVDGLNEKKIMCTKEGNKRWRAKLVYQRQGSAVWQNINKLILFFWT